MNNGKLSILAETLRGYFRRSDNTPLPKGDLKLEFPETVTETGFYPVQRTSNGQTDTIEVLMYADKDLQL